VAEAAKHRAAPAGRFRRSGSPPPAPQPGRRIRSRSSTSNSSSGAQAVQAAPPARAPQQSLTARPTQSAEASLPSQSPPPYRRPPTPGGSDGVPPRAASGSRATRFDRGSDDQRGLLEPVRRGANRPDVVGTVLPPARLPRSEADERRGWRSAELQAYQPERTNRTERLRQPDLGGEADPRTRTERIRRPEGHQRPDRLDRPDRGGEADRGGQPVRGIRQAYRNRAPVQHQGRPPAPVGRPTRPDPRRPRR
jgi:hypothetical protein